MVVVVVGEVDLVVFFVCCLFVGEVFVSCVEECFVLEIGE